MNSFAEKIKIFFLGKTKKGRILSIIAYALLLYFLLITFCLQALFHEKYEIGSFVFFSNTATADFQKTCDEIYEKIRLLPFYDTNKKVRVYFTDSLGMYHFLSPTSLNSFGNSLTLGNYHKIVLAPSDFENKITISGMRENNKRNVVPVLLHESAHVYLTKGCSLINRLTVPVWIEEGICEYFAMDSSYNTEIGLQHVLNNTNDSSKSFKYFTYRLAVTWLFEEKNLSLSEVLSYKGTLKDVLEEFKQGYFRRK